MSEENVNSSELEHEKALKGEMGAVAAGAVPLDEKHEAKKDPEHADSHSGGSGLSSTFSTGGAVIEKISIESHKEPGRSSWKMEAKVRHPKGVNSSVGGTFRVEKEETKKEAEEAEGDHEKKETKKEAE